MNKVFLIGRLTADPVLKSTPGGIVVSSFNIAVGRDFKDESSEYKADFISVVAWRNTAEFICKYFSKGKPILIEGRIQTRSYEDKDSGNKRYVTEVIAENVRFLPTDSKNVLSTHNESVLDIEDFEEITDTDMALPF